MKKVLLFFLLAWLVGKSALAQDPPNFSLMLHGGGDYSTGFIPGYQPGFSAGLWAGIRMSENLEGYWGLDYYNLPGVVLPIYEPNLSEPVSLTFVLPTDDVSISVNARWHLSPPWNYVRQQFQQSFYLMGGIGMDLIVDQYPRLEGEFFYNSTFDILASANLGAGMEFPLGDARQWLFYTEALDHFIFWEGLGQVFTVRAGIKIMVDSAHVDPFR